MVAQAAESSSIVWYWPNVIGYVRVLFLFLAVNTFYKHAWTAAGYYTISELLDALDGQLARAFNQSSLLGACLDQVTDRLSTLAIYMLLGSRFPQWCGVIFALVAADMGGHWVYVHAQTLRGARTHKEVPVHWPLLQFYYSHRVFMFSCHLAYEVFLCSFLVCSFHVPGTTPHFLAKALGIMSVPLAAVKIVRPAQTASQHIFAAHQCLANLSGRQFADRRRAEELIFFLSMKSGYRPLEINRRGDSTISESGGATAAKGLVQLLIDFWPISWMFGFIPIAFAAKIFHWGDTLVFTLNFLAIVPLAWIMGQATEDCAASIGTIAGGLMNAWFGNIVEMLLCIAGLRNGELVVVRCTLVGSVLSNLLLVAGCSLFAGGLFYKVQEFSAPGASTTTSLLLLGLFCAALPTLYDVVAKHGLEQSLKMSRIASLLLVSVYIQFMVFQMRTHSCFYDGDEKRKADEQLKRGRFGSKISQADEEEQMYLSPIMAGVVLGVCTLICSFCSEFLIGAIGGTVSQLNVSKEFVGIILLPIIGNAAEHYTSVVVAIHDSMDLSLGCAVGSSCQMLLFVTPMTILAGWILGQPLSLDLHAFEALILLLSILLITGILQDGYSNWLEGSILCTAYIVIAIVYFCEDPKLSEII